MLGFPRWAPDVYAFNGAVSSEAKGVLPGPTGKQPWPSLSAFSLALGAPCRGAFLVRKTDGGFAIFAGTQTKLYKYVGATDAWLDVTRLVGGDYSVPDDEQWSGDQFGPNLILVNRNDQPQVIDISSGTNFANLGGSPPRATYVKTVGNHLFLAGLDGDQSTVRWSGYRDPTHWIVGQRDSDFQTFPDGGFVNGLTGLETGYIFQRGAIRRFFATQDRTVFGFARVEAGRGLLAPSSLGTIGGRTYGLSEDGFFAIEGGAPSVLIGADQIDKWFQSEVNYNRIYSVIGAADPVRARMFFLFPSVGNDTPILDRMLCYDQTANEWTHADVEASHIFPAATAGYSMETLDALGYTLDTLPFSLDSKFLEGGAPYLAAFDADDKMAFFTGSPLAARCETADFQPVPGRRAFVQGVIPYTDASAITVSVGKKERPQDVFTYGAASAINAQGFSPQRASARIHRYRVDIPAGESWTHLAGIDPVIVDDGDR